MKKRIIICGINGLVGKKIAHQLFVDDFEVVGCDISVPSDSLEFLAGFEQLDLTVSDDYEQTCGRLIENHSPIHGWVNSFFPRFDGWNASDDYKNDFWHENVKGHMNAYCLITRAVCEFWKVHEQAGSLVNISSIFGSVAHDFEMYRDLNFHPAVPYTAIKGGINMFSKFCASKYGINQIRVNTLSPGPIESERVSDDVRRGFLKKIPLKRFAKPDDVAHACSFLLSDNSNYITGHDLKVDGGYTSI